jgi:DNA-binding NarL/FixJ family response regulator
MATVLLCTNEPVLAEGLKMILSERGGMPLRCCGAGIDDISRELESQEPDLLLVDLTSDSIFSVLKSLQDSARRTKIVLWVHSISTELALQAMSLGIRGIMRKTLPVETLLRCLNCVHEGELWFEKTLTDSFMSARRYSLTRREGQLVALLSQGLKNKEIATALTISEGTVKVYLSRLFQKLGVKDRFELALYGLKNLAPGAGSLDKPTGETGTRSLAPVWQAPRSFFVERVPIKTDQRDQRRPVKSAYVLDSINHPA